MTLLVDVMTGNGQSVKAMPHKGQCIGFAVDFSSG